MIIQKFFFTNFPKQYGKFLAVKGYILLPLKILLFKFKFNIFFGNKDQDKWVVKEIMKFKKNGFFLDLAATDGIHENNTFFLEKRLNWHGVCIEPNKKYFEKLKKNRTASCFCEVIDEKEEEIDFFPNKGIGGIVGENYDNNFIKRKKILSNAYEKNFIEKRKTKRIESILALAKAPTIIDYFSLDVEGSETGVIKSFPFNKYKINCMTIERPTPEINKILFKNDYIFVKNFKVDSFYIHKDIQNKINIKLEKFSQIEKKKW